MVRVKNMYFGSPSDSWNRCVEAKSSYVQYINRLGEAKLRILELTLMFHHLPSAGPMQLCVSTQRMYPRSEYFLHPVLMT